MERVVGLAEDVDNIYEAVKGLEKSKKLKFKKKGNLPGDFPAGPGLSY